MKGFINALTYIKGRGIVRANIGLQGDKIAYVGSGAEGMESLIDTGDNILLPGFIDEHIHGAGGADVMDGTANALDTMSRTLLKEGTTSFLATTMTQSEENIMNALKNAASYTGGVGARLAGIHLEGPFISAKQKGAQPERYVQKPQRELFRKFQEAAQGKIKMVTLAPEEDDGLIEYLNGCGVVVSCGHSDAEYEDITRNINCVTHTFNAQSPLHHRRAGVVGAALLNDWLACEIIADTVHVSPPALKLFFKCKPKDKAILITDAMRAKGSGDGESELGGQKVYVKGGQARLADGSLAGSVLKMNEALKNAVQKCGVPLEEAVDCATFNPAANLSLDDRGIIREGCLADFTLLGGDFTVLATVVGGRLLYRK